MVPLLKRHFHLAWHGFAAEIVYMSGTKLQSHGQCVNKMSHIFIGLCGGRVSRRLSSGFPPSIWLGGSRRPNWLSCGSHPPPLRKVTSQPSTSGSSFPTGFPQGVGRRSLGGAFSSPRAMSWKRSSMSCHNSSSARSPRFACN